MPSVEVHILSYNEREILPWTVDAYDRWADRIIVHDAFSNDGTREAIAKYFPWVEVRDWDTGDQIRDDLAAALKSTAWRGTDADWVAVVDADEILYAPKGFSLDWATGPILRPVGYDMIADRLWNYETSDIGSRFTDFIKRGAPNDRYAKPILFRPAALKSIRFSPGAHFVESAVGIDGKPVQAVDCPDLWLCHCKYIGPVERTAAEFARDQSRLSQQNRDNGWGSFLFEAEPAALARQRRAALDARATVIIP